MTTARLADVASINPRGGSVAPDELISFVGMAELDAASATARPLETRRFGEVSKGYTVFRDRDVLVAKITPCWENGKIGQARLEHHVGVGSTEFHVVRPGPRVDERYLLHLLRQPWIRAAGELRMTGSGGQRRVPVTFLQDLEIPLPPLDEQRRIAAILDQAAVLRAKRYQTISHLDRLAHAIFLEMFGDPASPANVVRFGDIASLRGGRNLVADDANLDSVYRVLKISAVTTGRFKPSESKPLPEGYEPPVAHLVRKGDLLMSRANTAELVGAVAYVDDVPANVALPDKIWRFDWCNPCSVPVFYHALFQAPSIRRRISQLATGTGGSMKNISKSKLEALELPVVAIEEQRLFAERIAAIPRFNMGQLDELYASLQSRAFRGEL